MASLSAKTISSILDEALTIDDKSSSSSIIENSNSKTISTSRLLLEELKKQSEAETPVIRPALAKIKELDPLLIQIGESKTEPPKYWNGLGTKQNNNNSSALATQAKEMTKNIPLPSGHKQKQQKRSRGEAYSDKHSNRLASQQHRKQRLDAYSKIY